jgi:hypothetical protein
LIGQRVAKSIRALRKAGVERKNKRRSEKLFLRAPVFRKTQAKPNQCSFTNP